MKKQQEHEESGEKAPLWIISFADMISLLMAFFVMLQTLAADKSNEFLSNGKGRVQLISGEFRRSMDSFGMPNLFGKPAISTSFTSTLNKSSIESPDAQVTNPAIDGQEEKTRRLFSELSGLAETHISQFNEQKLSFQAAPITFAGENADLNTEAKAYLAQFASTLQQTNQVDKASIYIVGLSPDISTPQRQWTISELRARTVKSFLQSLLPEKSPDSIFWWGAGPNTGELESSDASNTLPYILIATETPSN
jgi:outer membrane protein OmpA-like peptidoglycan-associated protein